MSRSEAKPQRGLAQHPPPDSVAAIVGAACAPRHPASGSRAAKPAAVPAPHSIAGVVLAAPQTGARSRRRALWLAGILATGLHTVGAVVAIAARPTRETPKPKPQRTVMVAHEISLDPPEPPPEPRAASAPTPPPTPEPQSAPSASPKAQRLAEPSPAAPAPAADAPPPPPARAGQVVAQEPPAEPVDFTDFAVAEGSGQSFAGGVTAPSGTSTQPVHSAVVDPQADPHGPHGDGSLARPVTLPARNWRCPWPEAAEALGIDEQVVVLRAVVDASGHPQEVTLLADPGHGFGDAALDCAEAARFAPARDRNGKRYAATSPPIRVRFTR